MGAKMRIAVGMLLAALFLAACGSPGEPSTAERAEAKSMSTYEGITCADTDMIRDEDVLFSEASSAGSRSPREALSAYFSNEPALRALNAETFEVVEADDSHAVLVAKREGRSVARVDVVANTRRWHVERSVMCQSYVTAARG